MSRLCSINMLSPYQSGFGKQHSTVAASIKVFNYAVEALDAKDCCAALFIDLSKLDSIHHVILGQTLSEQTGCKIVCATQWSLPVVRKTHVPNYTFQTHSLYDLC